MEFNSLCDLVQLTANGADQVLALVIQGTNSPYEGVQYPMLLKRFPQYFPRDKVKSLPQVQEHNQAGWANSPAPPQAPAEGVELVVHIKICILKQKINPD